MTTFADALAVVATKITATERIMVVHVDPRTFYGTVIDKTPLPVPETYCPALWAQHGSRPRR